MAKTMCPLTRKACYMSDEMNDSKNEAEALCVNVNGEVVSYDA